MGCGITVLFNIFLFFKISLKRDAKELIYNDIYRFSFENEMKADKARRIITKKSWKSF